ncbi:MAG: 16S rRNA (adenine(1518)-N(6)/adenine(1519)-N(6))-dimethyltransferase RsmA [Oscillospiraceae bacterium]|jgi:16S rRNA (adenine1518-N6/adenine1519-N6)-dimethyltransferase|nr:16S rRNA (adenine(1518)-N(6)/adenine(1519)-N(6))-dimethyltransferase RsmA [Oscillospiraceae bacterium]
MPELYNISVIREVLKRHGFNFSKALGQNFITNPSVCSRMGELSGIDKNSGVIEIGPGIGVLSEELAKRAGKLVCIEIDKKLLPVLDETLAGYDNIKIINGDILRLDLKRLIQEEFSGKKVFVCANLPYYITSPVIMKLLEEKPGIKSITVMVQKEAARRICAEPGTREAGAISLAVRYYTKPRILFNVSRGSFLPPPSVDSSVIRLELLPAPSVTPQNEKLFFKTVKAGFSMRRKTLQNCLLAGFGLSKAETAGIISACGLGANVRAEELSLRNFCDIADKINNSKELLIQ